MGLRNPFRFAVNRNNGDVYVGDYSPDADHADPARGPAGQGRWMLIKQPGQLWLAVLRHADTAVRRLRLRHQDVGRAVQLQRADERLAAQHRPEAAAARSRSRTSGTPTTASPLFPRARARRARGQRRHRADGRPGVRPGARATRSRVPLPELLQGQAAVLRVVARLHQGVPPQREPPAGRDPPVPAFVDNPMDMEFGPGRRALRARVRRRLLRREPGRAAGEDQLRPRQPHAGRQGRGDADRRPRAARRSRSRSAGTTDPDGDPLSYAWDFEADGTVDSTAANPTSHVHAATAPTARR